MVFIKLNTEVEHREQKNSNSILIYNIIKIWYSKNLSCNHHDHCIWSFGWPLYSCTGCSKISGIKGLEVEEDSINYTTFLKQKCFKADKTDKIRIYQKDKQLLKNLINI